jgi:hypothetical protein
VKWGPRRLREATAIDGIGKCFFYGRRESGEWHYSDTLGHVVCNECYRRAMTRPSITPAVEP